MLSWVSSLPVCLLRQNDSFLFVPGLQPDPESAVVETAEGHCLWARFPRGLKQSPSLSSL